MSTWGGALSAPQGCCQVEAVCLWAAAWTGPRQPAGFLASFIFPLCHKPVCEVEPRGRGPETLVSFCPRDLQPWALRPPVLPASGCRDGFPPAPGLLRSCAGGCWAAVLTRRLKWPREVSVPPLPVTRGAWAGGSRLGSGRSAMPPDGLTQPCGHWSPPACSGVCCPWDGRLPSSCPPPPAPPCACPLHPARPGRDVTVRDRASPRLFQEAVPSGSARPRSREQP